MHMQEIRETGKFEKSDYRKPFKVVFLFFIQAKDDRDISSGSSSSDEDTTIGAYWVSNVGFPFTDRVTEEEF